MSSTVDLTNCDREQIHLLGRIQGCGFLLGLSRDWVITHVSANVSTFVKRNAQDLLDQPLATLLPRESIHSIRNCLQNLAPDIGSETVFGLRMLDVPELFDISAHTVGETIVLDFEPAGEAGTIQNDTVNIRRAIHQLSAFHDESRRYSHAVRFLRIFTGFDRVMMYRFDEDFSGEVIAEAKRHGLDGFLGLHFPATDIPKQARELFRKNPIRLIADVADEGVEILSAPAQHAKEVLDLSKSGLRAVSPIHLEYLRNMKVGASFTIPLISNGEIWGLIACHNMNPRGLDVWKRKAASLFAQMLSLVIQAQSATEEKAYERKVADLTADLSRAMSLDEGGKNLLPSAAFGVATVLAADGYAVLRGADVLCGGDTPDSEDIEQIRIKLIELPNNQVFSTRHLEEFVPDAARYAGRAAGLLSIPISRRPGDYLLLFRRERVRQITWAGNPDKAVLAGPNGSRLTPRESFSAWKETFRHQSKHWTAAELRAAAHLRVMLLEVVLLLSDVAAADRALAVQRQELLIAELNHRVRNILGLVRGLITQSKVDASSTTELVGRLDQRVQALARAHDLITRHSWQATALSALIQAEKEGFLPQQGSRVRLSGPEVLISAQAFPTLALVVHEMFTNSAKYGSLSSAQGRVELTVSAAEEGVTIHWQEIGGPAVEAPLRRGFGSAIILRALPHELGGQAEIDYALGGVTATFWLPRQHASVSARPAEASPETVGSGPSAMSVALPEAVLILEDNLLIAMEAEDLFRSLGAVDVVVVSNCNAAKSELDGRATPFDFALLDINLGAESSLPVAELLVAQNVPFAFATGYGDGFALPESLKSVRVLSKPYDRDMIASLFK